MYLEDILILLVDYLDYKSLESLSKVINVPEAIWHLYLFNNYGFTYSIQDVLRFIETNSLEVSKYKKKLLFDEVGIKNIRRIFVFNQNGYLYNIVYSSYDRNIYNRYGKYVNVITFEMLRERIKDSKLLERVKLDYELGYWSQDEMDEVGIENVLGIFFRRYDFDFENANNIFLNPIDFDLKDFQNDNLKRTIKVGKKSNKLICELDGKFIYYKHKNNNYYISVYNSLSELFKYLKDKTKLKILVMNSMK